VIRALTKMNTLSLQLPVSASRGRQKQGYATVCVPCVSQEDTLGWQAKAGTGGA
jgi:hypothetical protein